MAEPPSPTPTIGAHQVVVVGADEQGDVAVDLDRWTGLAREVLHAEGVAGELTLTFVDRDEIADLNVEHMGTAGPTDVLSFPLDETVPRNQACRCCSAMSSCARPSPPTRRADHAGTLDDELALLVVHGVLHVVGHDHAEPDEATIMRRRELELLERLHWAGPAPAGFRQQPRRRRRPPLMLAVTFTGSDALLLATIIVLLVLLALLAVAETGINRISLHKAEAIAHDDPKRGRALLRLVEEPEKFLNPVLLTVNILQTASAFLSTILLDRLFGTWGLVIGFVLNVGILFVFTEAIPKTWAVLHSEQAAKATSRPTLWLVKFWPLRLRDAGPDRLRQLDPARQGAQAGAVRLRAGAARHRRGGRQRRGDRARGARAHREHHRVRRHRRPRGDGAPPGHDHRPPRRHRHRCPRPGDRPRQQPPAVAGRGLRRHRRADLHEGPDPGRAVGRRQLPGRRAAPGGPLHPREQAGRPADAGDAGRQVPPGDRRQRVRRRRRPDHPGGLPGGARRRDRRRVRHRGAGHPAPAQRRLPRRGRAAGRGAQRDARHRSARRGVGHGRRVPVRHARARPVDGRGRRVRRLALHRRGARRPAGQAGPGQPRAGPGAWSRRPPIAPSSEPGGYRRRPWR